MLAHLVGAILSAIFKIPDKIATILWVYCVVEFAVFVTIGYFEIKWINRTDVQNEVSAKLDFYLLKLSSFFIVIMYGYGVYEHLRAIKLYSESENEVTVIMENKQFSTSRTYRYLGKTKSFIFFYDLTKKQADVFPSGDVKTLLIRNGIIYKMIVLLIRLLPEY